ncbi:MAG TPA: class I SAM-dependent methyltransferase [Candidatus Magasanikbacteria bacterium]|nr:class I SAM-dependent methyltransferase [Candidatus Magasanikbacteria bacterium]
MKISNNYNKLATKYSKSDHKPDKKYSILPTVLKLAGSLKGKTVMDLGCGDGFFAKQFSLLGAKHVIGIDKSKKQITLAKKTKDTKISYILADIFKDPLPKADIINSPFVLNYAQDASGLSQYFQILHKSLNKKGKIILLHDLPNGSNLRKFGAKKMLTKNTDGAQIKIDLYNQNKHICTLFSTYFKQKTIVKLLKDTKFKKIKIRHPLISADGYRQMGEKFWDGYLDNCELGYITAEKL